MSNFLYVIDDLVFENDEGKHNAKSKAIHYCNKHNIKTDLIIQMRDEVELAYYRLLCEKKSRGEVKSIETNMYATIMQSFYNANHEFIPPLNIVVPFVVKDNNGKIHYQKVISDIKDLNVYLIHVKHMFDKHNVVENKYLELIYLDDDGTFKTWTLDDFENVQAMYRLKKHKDILAKLRQLREQQKYDRLKRLRDEGKITDNQRKELYRLEDMYERH